MSEYDFLKDEDNIKLVGKISNLIDTQLPDFVKEEGIKFPVIAMPLRTILAGTDHTPSVGSIISIMGRDTVHQRWQDFKRNYDN